MGGRYQIAAFAALLLAVAIGIWTYGNSRYYAGQRELLTEIEQARAKSVAQKQRIDNEIDALGPVELRERALEWVRDNAR
jgi:hypothetical protein